MKRLSFTLLVVAALLLASLLPGGLRGVYAQESGAPIGWHDGVEGAVDAANCGAFGWAVDPDNPDTDLQVRILVDDNPEPVATVTADLLREDVGACSGGTCGFSVNLWDLIPHGEAHQITAQAQDLETGTWVDLAGTPKSLTCFGYPEGFHDGAEGTVDEGACVASGWAADPDDRDRDVLVRILADGTEVASAYASDYGEDMDALGICPGGTCRFTIQLWDLISHDVEHQITAQAYDEETLAWRDLSATPKSLTCQAPPPPTPWLTAFPEWEYIEAVDWPVGVLVHLAIYEAGTPDSPVYEADTTTMIPEWEPNPNRGWALFPLAGYDLKVGDRVVITGGETTIEHVVQNLAVTSVNIANNTVAGTADAGAVVWLWPHGFDQTATVQATAGDNGAWLADFTGLFDITFGTGGRSQIVDVNGNATAVGWSGPFPWLAAFPENEAVEGWEWPDGATVFLAIDDPATSVSPDYTNNGTAAETTWGDPRTYLRIEFAGEYDLKVGDVVMLTDGTTSITHVVKNLSVTSANGAADFVAGTADAGAVVWVWPHGSDQTATRQVAADAGGHWMAGFAGVFDLVEGTGGRSQVLDEAGNVTAVDWVVSPPPPAPPPVGGIVTPVRLPADAGWMDSAYLVSEGVPVGITAKGQATTARPQDYPDAISGPDGQPTGCWMFDEVSPCALDGAPYGALIGKIGPDGDPFVIGSSFVLYPNASGDLYLAVNDNLDWYGDNRGSYIVLISP